MPAGPTEAPRGSASDESEDWIFEGAPPEEPEAPPAETAAPKRRRRKLTAAPPPLPAGPGPDSIQPPPEPEPEFRQAPAWFEQANERPEALWWVRREGPPSHSGRRVPTGTLTEPIHGRLSLQKIGAILGTCSVSITPDDPMGSAKPRWYGPIEVITPEGRPKMDLGLVTEKSSTESDLEKDLKELAAEIHAPPPDPEVDVWDPLLEHTVKVPQSLAPKVQRKNQPPPPQTDSRLTELVRDQRESLKEQRDVTSAILRTLQALTDRLNGSPQPTVPAVAGDNPWKDMLALEQRRNDQTLSDLRAEIRSLQSRSPGAEPVAMIGTILNTAKDLAGLAHGGGSPTGMAALSAIDKVIDRTSAALATVWPSAAPAFQQLLWNAAWAMPAAQAAPALPAQNSSPAQAVAAPQPAAPPQPNPQEQARMMEGLRVAIDLMGQVLDGKVSPEDAWSRIKAVAPPDAIAKIATLTSAAHVEIALSTIAQMPLLADKRDVLLAAAKRATGDARAIAERFVQVVRGG